MGNNKTKQQQSVIKSRRFVVRSFWLSMSIFPRQIARCRVVHFRIMAGKMPCCTSGRDNCKVHILHTNVCQLLMKRIHPLLSAPVCKFTPRRANICGNILYTHVWTPDFLNSLVWIGTHFSRKVSFLVLRASL